MQCKDIPELPILRFLARHYRASVHHPLLPRDGIGASWYRIQRITAGGLWKQLGINPFEETVRAVMPECPDKVALAKMRNLARRGLVDGCTCGCRGGFFITSKGEDYLQKADLDKNVPPT